MMSPDLLDFSALLCAGVIGSLIGPTVGSMLRLALARVRPTPPRDR